MNYLLSKVKSSRAIAVTLVGIGPQLIGGSIFGRFSFAGVSFGSLAGEEVVELNQNIFVAFRGDDLTIVEEKCKWFVLLLLQARQIILIEVRKYPAYIVTCKLSSISPYFLSSRPLILKSMIVTIQAFDEQRQQKFHLHSLFG